jgi:hypothetical protein
VKYLPFLNLNVMATEKKTTRKPKQTETVSEPKAEITFVTHKVYKMEALPGAKYLIEGKVYEVSGDIARELHKKGYAKLV